MTGGEIYKNTATQCGGGVNVQPPGIFFKTGGGTITGSDDTNNGNVVKGNGIVQENRGHAVCVVDDQWIYIYRKETTAGPDVNLDASKNKAQGGGWDND